MDIDREIRLVRRNQAIPAQGPISPEVWGYDPALKTEMSDFDRPRAKALLDMHGYTDRNGDGWREQPGGQPLLLEYATSPDQQSRQLTELWKKNMDAIGVRMDFMYSIYLVFVVAVIARGLRQLIRGPAPKTDGLPTTSSAL